MTGIQDILKMLSPAYALGSSKGGSNFLFGQPEQEQQFQKFTPGQQSSLDQLLQQGSQNADITGMENLAQKRFSEETVPSLAERFTSMGGGQRSSAFQSALGRSGSDLQAQLGALKPQFGMQQLGMGLQPRYDTGYKPATQGAINPLLQSLMSLLPLLAGL